MIDLRNASLLDFLPESIASDPDIVALSLAIDPELRDVGAAIIEAVILPRIAELEEAILDELAWAFRFNRLQIWDVASVEKKRALLVNVFAIRKKSGTRFAVRRVLELVDGVTGVLVEWFEEGAAPYTYRLRLFVNNIGITLSQLVQISELTYRFEPTRAKLSEFATEADSTGPLYPYTAVTIGRQTTIPFGGP
jgi:phage tail P2-like protein